MGERDQEINILLFSALFPHVGEPTLGIFVENRLRHLVHDENVKATVVAPVPWFPFKHQIFGSYGRAARAPKKEVRHGITVYHPRYLIIPKIGMLLTPYSLARAGLKTIKKLLKSGEKIDLIDAHYLYPDGVAAGKIAQKLQIPFVMTARGSDVTQIAHIKLPRLMILNAISLSDHVITVSQSLKDKLIKFGAAASKISSLRNGVDLGKYEFKSHARKELTSMLGVESCTPIVIFAGWLIQRKRVDIVIETLSKHQSAIAILIGEGPKKNELKKLAHDLGVQNRIFFLGQKQPTDMPFYFSAADVLMLPSEREGWANVLLEAMACGTPVISRAVDGACELVTTPEAGRLVDQDDDVASYSNALKSLLEEKPSRAKVRLFAENFDWRATSRGQYEIFRTAIHNFKTVKKNA